MIRKSDIVLSVASGILLVLGFPVFDFYPAAWAALVPLFLALRGKNPKSSFCLGLFTGALYFMGTIYWVYHSMYYYGGLPLALSVTLMILLSLSQALYVAIFSMLFNFTTNRSAIPALISAPPLWVTLEYVRTYTIFSFPWSTLGYSQHSFLPIIQISDITGVYGVSFLVAASSAAVYDIIVLCSKTTEGKEGVQRWSRSFSIVIFCLVVGMSLHYGVEKLRETSRPDTIKVSIVQANIEQHEKWDPQFRKTVIETHKELTMNALKNDPDIVIWPESAVPFIFGYDKALTDEIVRFQKQLDTYLLFGSVMARNSGDNNPRLSNSAVLLSPEGHTVSVYDKIHLVPYGEYVPLGELFPFVNKMVAAIGDFVPGEETTVMKTPFVNVGTLICYEIIFPGLVRKFVDNGATMLATITNDAWFGTTNAPYQHFSMAVFRAVENRVSVIRSANTGISGFIDSKGRILDQSDIFVQDVMTASISVGGERSFYTQYGDIFAYLCIIGSLLLIFNRVVRERRNRP